MDDVVIAGLRDRGWPEHGLDDNDCVVWRGTEGGSVRFGRGEWGHVFEYGTADGSEGGRTSFAEGVSPERVVEAIDRLRWVIGLSARRVGQGNLAGCLREPVPLIPPEGVVEALAAAHMRGAGLDPDGPPSVPLRVTPAPKEYPYAPTRWIGE